MCAKVCETLSFNNKSGRQLCKTPREELSLLIRHCRMQNAAVYIGDESLQFYLMTRLRVQPKKNTRVKGLSYFNGLASASRSTQEDRKRA